MDITQEIFEKAKLVYKEELSSSAEGSLFEMCAAARCELLQKLKDDVAVDSIREEFVRAAAVLGIALFVGLECSSIDSFSAGNVTLKKRGEEGTRSASASLRSQAELMLKGYLKDGGFYFGAVRC
ncbi:MAG: hypothetical protein KBI01_07915 [Oscillospiraceae bacterium]|nr:hypothetical protein [Oscillospiraceae bacterium]